MADATIVIETLNAKKLQLQSEKESAIARFDSKIKSIDAAIRVFTGKKEGDNSEGDTYDDESPDYIKSSEEEM